MITWTGLSLAVSLKLWHISFEQFLVEDTLSVQIKECCFNASGDALVILNTRTAWVEGCSFNNGSLLVQQWRAGRSGYDEGIHIFRNVFTGNANSFEIPAKDCKDVLHWGVPIKGLSGSSPDTAGSR